MTQKNSTNYPRPLAWNYELLADYVDGLVDQETKDKIEASLQDSEEAAMIVSGILHYYQEYGEDRDGLEQYLDELAEKFRQRVMKPEAKIKRFTFSSRVLRMAAVILLLVASVPLIIWLTRPSTPDANALLALELSTPYIIPTDQRDTSVEENLQTKAYEAYKNASYSESITLLQEFAEEDDLEAYDRFVMGLSYLYSENYEQAVSILDRVVREKNSRFVEQSRWYLALAHLKMGNKEGGTNALHEIVNLSGHYKSQEASELLKSIERK